MVHAAHRSPTVPIQYEMPMVIHDTFVHEVDLFRCLFRWLLDDDYRLRAGECVSEHTGGQEIILVMIEGKATVMAAGTDWGELGERMDVFEKTPPPLPLCAKRCGMGGHGHDGVHHRHL